MDLLKLIKQRRDVSNRGLLYLNIFLPEIQVKSILEYHVLQYFNIYVICEL